MAMTQPFDYLAAFDQAPTAEKYPLVQTWMKKEPLPFFKQLRTERPILVTPECTLVALFSDVRDALLMPTVLTVDLYKPKMGVTATEVGYLMAHDDDALHYREKSLMQAMLNRDDLGHVRALVQKTCIDILDRANGQIDIVTPYCRTVPATLVQDYFGFDGVEAKDLIEWSFWNQYDAFHNQPFDLNSPEKFDHIVKMHAEVSDKLIAYLATLVGRKLLMAKIAALFSIPIGILHMIKAAVMRLFGIKQKVVPDDIVSRMLKSSFAASLDFAIPRLATNAGGLLIGAIETTSQAVSQTIQYFIEHPAILANARTAARKDDPGDFDGYVWEALRYVPISPYMFRQASTEVTLASGTPHQTTIAKGTNVLLLTQSAMFDTYAYEAPEQFNPQRNWYHHFNFGFGSHDCLGKYVGMVMIPEMVRQVLLRSNLRATSAMNYKDGPFPEEYRLAW